MKILNEPEVQAFLASAESEYDVRVPTRLHDGTRALGTLEQGPLALAGGAVLQKVTAVFFPQMETMLSHGPEGMQVSHRPEKPLFVVGFTAQDVDSLSTIDNFFAEDYRDDLYFNRRDRAVVVCVSGQCGKDGAFLKIAGSGCDMELICTGQDYLLLGYTDAGKALVDKAPGNPGSIDDLASLQARSDTLGTEDLELLQQASRLLIEDRVPEDFWQDISDRCIACTSCNLTCPTCTCFDVFDREVGDRTERWRLWDSCQLDGFSREASGHNPLGHERLRTRRRIHHKLAADVTRWDTISCTACGRCDQVCPTGIGIQAVCQDMVDRYGPNAQGD